MNWNEGQILNGGGEVPTGATAPENPVREGYTFTGWDKTYTDIKETTIVRATYEILTFTVTFVDFDGRVLGSETVEYGKNATAPGNPAREGYTFTGWDKNSSAWTDVKADVTVTALYEGNSGGTVTPPPVVINPPVNPPEETDPPEEDTYTVTFVDWDGSTLSVQTVARGSSASAPGEPSRAGYIFRGWDSDYSNVQSDITVTAMYAPEQETGSINPPIEGDDGDSGAVIADGAAPTVNILGNDIPVSGGSVHWALLNLIFAAIGIIVAVWTILRAMAKRREEEHKGAERQAQRRPGLIALTFILGVAGIVFFFLTENISLSAALTDRWTIVSAIILIVGIVTSLLSFRRNRDEDEQEDADMPPAYGK